MFFFFFSSRRRHTRYWRDWSSDVCSSDLMEREDLCPRDNLIELLKTTSLSNSELDRMLVKNPKIPIITIHQAKGAEFEYVFLSGLQQGTFPNYLAIKENNLEEEKRLFYVGMTRAKIGRAHV